MSMRALVVVCRYLGDTLIATPLARSLENAGYEVDWLVSPGTENIISGQPFVHTLHVIKPKAVSTWKMLRKLRGQYDVACVTTPSDRPMLIAFAAAKKVFALASSRPQDAWKRKLAKDSSLYDGMSHMASYTFDLARMAGVPVCRDVGITWSEDDDKQVHKATGWKRGTRFVHIHPFARCLYKHWPQENWQGLISRILDSGLHIAITASPSEKQVAESLAESFPSERICLLAGTLAWPQLASLSRQAIGYIGMDTANTHLAASTGTPTLALFGPTDPRIWGPWPNGYQGRSPYHRSVPGGIQQQGNIMLVQQEFGCVPCQLEGCDRNQKSHSACLDALSVERVWNCWQKMIG